MGNVAQENQSVSTQSTVSDDVAEKKIRRSRGLRTLEHDMAELKKAGQKKGTKVDSRAPEKKQGSQEKTQKRGIQPIPKKPTQIPRKPSESPPPQTTEQPKTNYSEELARLAEKYIPEKKTIVPQNKPQNNGGAPSQDALKSFEKNKAFNDELHGKTNEKVPEEKEVNPTPIQSVPKLEVHPTPTEPKSVPITPKLETQPVEEKPIVVPETIQEVEPSEPKEEEKEPEKKFTDLTEEDITRELDKVLKSRGVEHKDVPVSVKEEPKQVTPEPREAPEVREKPQPSMKQLEDTISSVSQRITSSSSRIDTYKEELGGATLSLKNLFERREIINKNLDPIKEKERIVLVSIKEHEDKEASASNKIEKREAENKRWELENERRELEDERWRLEEIFEKLRLVIEKTEYEQVSIKKKLSEEETHLKELADEKNVVNTHRDLLLKREDKERAERNRADVNGKITNLKNELTVIRSTEEDLEKKKRELETRIGVLNDISSRRSLETERRTIEDKRRETEEKRWSLEDELKKYYGEKDEADRVVNILSTELDSLQNKFEELERNGKASTETKSDD